MQWLYNFYFLFYEPKIGEDVIENIELGNNCNNQTHSNGYNII